MIIALGFILPGVSGGVLAAILGVYERMIRFWLHIKDNFVEITLFTPVAIVMVLGIAAFSYPVNLLDITRLSFSWGFAGAIIGAIPADQRIRQGRQKSSDTVAFWLSFHLIRDLSLLAEWNGGTAILTSCPLFLAGALIA